MNIMAGWSTLPGEERRYERDAVRRCRTVAEGLAVVGVFSFEVAETKVAQVMDFARRHQHPLQCTMEKE